LFGGKEGQKMKKNTLLAVVITCLMVVPIKAFAVNINYPDFSDLSDFTLGARAAQLNTIPDDKLQLISGIWQRNGYALLTEPVILGQTFTTHFTFQITNNIGVGADWLVFNIQTENGLYSGNAVSVEFDIFNNYARDNYSGNHIGINVNHYFYSVVTQHVSTDFNNGDIWHAWIDYDGNILNVYASTASIKPYTPYISYAIDVADILGTSQVYLGFHAASGAYGADFAVLSWSFTSDLLADIIDFILTNDIEGLGPGNSADNRYNAFLNMLYTVSDLIEADDIQGACDHLYSVIDKCDCEDKPKDFITGPDSIMDELMDMLNDLMEDLGCE
jgi:hypothetical protein